MRAPMSAMIITIKMIQSVCSIDIAASISNSEPYKSRCMGLSFGRRKRYAVRYVLSKTQT